ncbi:hypothetical protein E2562_028662 [Oryza meyeriana var. granulata]|uniref:Uncharacterized protein n=1 Tax=Oryza meyeriana var. granulata TaxID=110450 RepID=A0A6G1BNH7_9ORYZ|nr:hypothetical protein E2562_028662 [Oryza meyeriana var. granulata]
MDETVARVPSLPQWTGLSPNGRVVPSLLRRTAASGEQLTAFSRHALPLGQRVSLRRLHRSVGGRPTAAYAVHSTQESICGAAALSSLLSDKR